MAYRHARSGVCESGAAISNLVPYETAISFGGTARSVLLKNFTIQETADGTPARCSGRVYGFTPEVGQELLIADDGFERYIFAGTVIRVRTHVQDDTPVVWSFDAVDYQWLMNKHALVFESFVNVGANTAISRILADYTDSAAGIEPGIIPSSFGNITMEFDGETVAGAINRIARSVGAFWHVCPNKRIHVYTTYPDGNALTLTNSTDAYDLTYEETLDQTRTRTVAEGGGSQTTAVVSSGGTEIPVEEIAGYVVGAVATPRVRAAGLLITYTGTDAESGPGNLTGCSGIDRDIPQGELVAYANQQDDATAQSDMATLLGGGLSGVVVHRARVSAIDSVVDAESIADSDLTFHKDPFESVSYKIVNAHYRPGKTIAASVTTPITISATLRIQSVATRFRGDPSDRAASGTEPELERQIVARPIFRQSVASLLGRTQD